ncbi:nucleotide-binding protein [Vibrio fluvialis]|nr:nucleotide-binding protein [Vibrio fluvialis]
MKPRLFIGSSVEGLDVAYAIQENLKYDAESTVWSQGVFDLSKTTMETLETTLNTQDFAVFVFSPDDEATMRGKSNQVVRDNVLFELGLFIGKLGRNRVYFLVPEKSNIHIPTDLLGVTPGTYDCSRVDQNWIAATGSVSNSIRKGIKTLGLINPMDELEKTGQTDLDLIENQEKEEKHKGWYEDWSDKNYTSAKDKLEKEIQKCEKEKIPLFQTWIAYLEYLISGRNDIEPVISKHLEYSESKAAKQLVTLMLYWEGKYKQSIALCNQFLSENPEFEEVALILAENYKSLGMREKSIEIVSKFKSVPATLELAKYYEKDPEERFKILVQCYLDNPRNKYITKALADECGESNRYKEALFLYNSLCKEYSEEDFHWGLLSNVSLKLDFYSHSLEYVRKASKIADEKKSWLIGNIGNLMSSKGFYSEAIEYYKKGLDLQESQYIHTRMSTAMKNLEDEEKRFEEALQEGKIELSKFLEI